MIWHRRPCYMFSRSESVRRWVVPVLLLVGWTGAAWPDEYGKDLYRQHCIGCHYWHGSGGGGYGGPAASLRTTRLDRAGLMTVVRCGLPGTGMPYHGRRAYQDGDCKLLPDQSPPPRAAAVLQPREIEAVTDHVLTRLRGRGVPTVAECQAFWGEDARQCQTLAPATTP